MGPKGDHESIMYCFNLISLYLPLNLESSEIQFKLKVTIQRPEIDLIRLDCFVFNATFNI